MRSIQSSSRILLFISGLMLLGFLGMRELWTQEHRWADIVFGMFYRHDFLHPYLGEVNYYDKPLLSYWFIAIITWLTGELTTWGLRLPSALAGMLAIWSIYRLGSRLKDSQLGLLAGWMLLTTFYFIFWARTSSADMLNMAGSLFAVSWYFDKRDQATFFDFSIFFLILALTALCKGLIGIVVALIVIFPDLLIANRWKNYLRFSVFLSMVPGAIVYLLPFWASTHFGGNTYHESGLYLVYRENILRYFQPFDHKDPIYTYFLYLPIYLLPWTVFFIPTLLSLKARWKNMTESSRWMVWSVLLLFLFLTVSGSRRGYYVLPLVPFAILLTADWILSRFQNLVWIKRFIVFFIMTFLTAILMVQPLYYAQGGFRGFVGQFKQAVAQEKSTSSWEYVLLDPESKVSFYLQLPPTAKKYDVVGARDQQKIASLVAAWPVLNQPRQTMIFISRKQYEPFLTAILGKKYKLIEARPTLGQRVLNSSDANLPIAYVPVST